jgi:hypothetical protein
MTTERKTTKEERRRHVAQMNANFRIEDFTPDAQDKALQQQYIDGKITLADMLEHARQFAAKAQGAAKE